MPRQRARSSKAKGRGKKQPPSPIARDDLPRGIRNVPDSKTTEEDLENLVADGLLPDQATLNWKVPERGDIPWGIEKTRQLVFRWMFVYGLGLPTCSFFRGLLYFYGLELCNLGPNSLLHVAVYIHLCEAFLGVRPHWKLFRYLFTVRPLPKSDDQDGVGGVGIQLRRKSDYIDMPLLSSYPTWKDEWFVLDNPPPSLPEYSAKIAPPLPSWTGEDIEEDLAEDPEVKYLLRKIQELKQKGVNGNTIVYSWATRGVQPIKRQDKPAWTYSKGDPTREVPDPVSKENIFRRVTKILGKSGLAGISKIDLAFNASIAHPPVRPIVEVPFILC